MSRYKVFIAYKGSTYGKKIASAIAKCIHENGMDPKIALAGAPGEIPSDSQERIFGWIQRCDAFVIPREAPASNLATSVTMHITI